MTNPSLSDAPTSSLTPFSLPVELSTTFTPQQHPPGPPNSENSGHSNSTIYAQLLLLRSQISDLISAPCHALSLDPKPTNEINQTIRYLSASLQSHHGNIQSLSQPLHGSGSNSTSLIAGTNSYISKLKEHALLQKNLEDRKAAIERAGRTLQEGEKRFSKSRGVRTDLRLSESSIERLGRELGLEVFADDPHPNTQTRRLTLVGKLMVLDVDFKRTPTPPQIGSLTLSFAKPLLDDPSQTQTITDPNAAQLLLSHIPQNADAFVSNLKRLVDIDRVSSGTENWFDVIYAIQDALNIIWEEEMHNCNQRQLDIIRKGWGKCGLNEAGMVGVSIKYFEGKTGENFKLILGVEEQRSQMQHEVALPALKGDLGIAYIDSKIIYVNEEDDQQEVKWPFLKGSLNWQTMSRTPSDSAKKRVILSLELDPPVILSVEGARNICEIVGYHDERFEGDGWAGEDVEYEELLFNGNLTSSITRNVLIPGKDGGYAKKKHEYRYIPVKLNPGRKVERIPFSHPGQIGPILRILRQYVMFSSLLKSFYPHSTGLRIHNGALPNEDNSESNGEDLHVDLASFISVPTSPNSTLPVTLTPTVTTLPEIHLSFPIPTEELLSLTVSLKENGDISVTNIKGVEISKKITTGFERLLEWGDVGVGIEWILKELKKSRTKRDDDMDLGI